MLDRSEVSPHRKILLFLQNQLFSEFWGGEGKRKFVRCRHSCTGLCVRNVSLFSLWFSVHEYSVVPILCILFCSFVRLFFFFFFGVCSSRPILFSNFDFPVNLISRADL